MKLRLALFAMSITLCACAPAPDASSRTSAETRSAVRTGLERVFTDGSARNIVDAVEKAGDVSLPSDMALYSLLLDVWYEKKATHPQFAWDTLIRPEVRIALGNKLAEAYRNGIIPLNAEDIRSFALAHYTDSDETVARRAVRLIGKVGNPDDIPLLTRLARDGAAGRDLFHEAVAALGYTCGDAARQAIDDVALGARADEKEFAQDILRIRETTVAAWCK